MTFGLNALRGRRKASSNGTLYVGAWDGRNARDLMRYTVEKGYRVESWELGNELCAGGVAAKVDGVRGVGGGGHGLAPGAAQAGAVWRRRKGEKGGVPPEA